MFVIGATLLAPLSACSTSQPAAGPSPIATASESGAEPVPSPSPSPSVTAAAECPPTPLEVTITYQLTTNASGGVLVNAQSNLPDGTVLNSNFFREGSFFAQDDGVLTGGKISFGPFSDKGTPLSGSYDMSITMPIARNQPDEVQECIGEAGEKLSGPLVTPEEITGDNVASIDTVVTVG